MNIKLKEELGNRVTAIVDGTLALLAKLGSAMSFGMFGPKPTPQLIEVSRMARQKEITCRSVDEGMNSLQHKPTIGLKNQS